jgi:VanZ family protein
MSEFTLTLIAGAVIGYFASVIANMTTPAFKSYFEKSKQGWVERNKNSALKEFERIKAFMENKEDRYMYFVAQWGYIGSYISMSIGLFIIATNLRNEADASFVLKSVAPVVFMIVSMFSMLRVFVTYRRLSVWYWRVNNYSGYRQSLIERGVISEN